MKKLLTILSFVLFCTLKSSAIELDSLWVTGRLETYAYFDTYQTVSVCNGVQFIMPSAPAINDVTQVDANNFSQLRFNVATSRIGGGTSVSFKDGNKLTGYVEVDFMNPNGAILGFRLRHAYAKLDMKNSSILVGQTSHISLYEQIAAPTVTFGSGYPFSSLSRPVQIRYSHYFEDEISLDVAASMFWGLGTEMQMQSRAILPDLTARVIVGSPKRNTVAAFLGFKSLVPNVGSIGANEMMCSLYGGFSGKVLFDNDMVLRGGATYGGDLSSLGMMGGFGVTANIDGYTPLNTISTWIDYETMRYGNFQFGAFFGYQAGLGSSEAISSVDNRGLYNNVENYWRLAPRAWYHYNMFSVGLEYMYTEATYMSATDDYFRAESTFPTTADNRITLLCRFSF